MRIFYFLQLYTLPWLCVLLLGIGYGVGMLYFYEPSKYQEIFKIASLSTSNTEKIDHQEKQDEVEKSHYQVLTDVLNVRLEPRVDSKIVRRLYKGERILITHIEKSWGSLVDEDLEVLGYVFLNPTNAVRIDPKSPMQTYYVNINTLNLRKKPSINDDVIKKIYFGQAVSLLEDLGNGWGKVEVDGLQGYVSMQWLKKME